MYGSDWKDIDIQLIWVPYIYTIAILAGMCRKWNGFCKKFGTKAQDCPNHDIWFLRVQEKHEL